MNESAAPTAPAPSEWARWLQSLALPVWARAILLVVFLTVMLGGLSMVLWGVWHKDRQAMATAIGLLTVALPVGLAVIGLVFGQRSEQRLAKATRVVLADMVPRHLNAIVGAPKGLEARIYNHHGCRANYLIQSPNDIDPENTALRFSIELNVRKVNITFSVPSHLLQEQQQKFEHNRTFGCYSHAIEGAQAEGYKLNPNPITYCGKDGLSGLLLYRTFGDDFLLQPIEQLYFCQDLAFLVRCMLEAQTQAAALQPSNKAPAA